MIFKQFYLNCLAHASYLIGDEETCTAAVVDPQRDVAHYLAFADEHKLRIKHVFLTHLHADFVAGHLELRDCADAAIYLGARAKAEYRFRPLADGDAVEFGKVQLKALETPGHTPESISIVVFDLARSESEPVSVLTGDTQLRRRLPLLHRRELTEAQRISLGRRAYGRHRRLGSRELGCQQRPRAWGKHRTIER